ncbi:MAG: dTDP-4-dehydrorhamnose reductase [Kineosporiaceae bacterium]
MARILVAGATGMLGRDVLAVLSGGRHEATGVGRDVLDVTDPDAALAAVAGYDVVLNCTAWTAVDDAETQEPQAFAVNAVGPANLARACARHGARLAHVSTDYVFAGDADTPYAEDAPPAPRSAYGRTKAAGEWAVRAELPGAHWIVRTAWLYGEHGNNFVRTMARLERERDTLDVVDDQHGQPTWSRDLAAALVALVDADAPAGTYHGTSAGRTTWFGLARAVFALLGADPDRVRPTSSDTYVRPAPRPAYSVLGHGAWTRAGLSPLRDWEVALTAAAPVLFPGR